MKYLLPALLFLSGCASGPTDFTQEYRAALEARPGVALPGAAAGREAVRRFAVLYGDLSPANVEARVRETYAPEAWFNDTLATKVGIDAIEAYLLRTAREAESVRATIDDVAVSGSDCYVRWTMVIKTSNMRGGLPLTTVGMTQLRFDREGRIILHQDFWDPGAGIYQHIPALGPAVRFVNRLITQ
jgi:hypothetical protein